MGPFGLKLSPNEAESFPGPYGSPPGPLWTHFGPKNPKKYQNQKIKKIDEIWTLANTSGEASFVQLWNFALSFESYCTGGGGGGGEGAAKIV